MRKIKNKIEPSLIDIEYLDRELTKLFESIHYGKADELVRKYRSRFAKEQHEKTNPDSVPTKNSIISVGKKLEILCAYGNFRIVKVAPMVNN